MKALNHKIEGILHLSILVQFRADQPGNAVLNRRFFVQLTTLRPQRQTSPPMRSLSNVLVCSWIQYRYLTNGVTCLGNQHSAAESMVGYLYQCRYGLLRGLQESKKRPSLTISIEKFDDVAFDIAGDPVELIQAKHRCTPGDVSDFSVDTWKTLRIWMDRVVTDPNGTADTRFVLLTTATAAADSALSALRASTDDRDEEASIQRLLSAANSSTNKDTTAARQQFLNLTDAQRHLLVTAIWVFDRAPNIIDVRDDIEDFLHFAAPPEHLTSLVSYLEGWWFNRTILALQGSAPDHIPLASIESKVFELSEGFKPDGLPLDENIDAMPAAGVPPAQDRVFVRQMKLVDASQPSVHAAVRDYYRAFTQRSRWAREKLLLDGDANRYDGSLIDAWTYEFAALCEDVINSDDQTRRLKGRELLRWAHRFARPLKGRDELWLSSGSFQILADIKKVGWHPEYQALLADYEKDVQ